MNEKKLNNIKKIVDTFHIIKKRLPSTHPSAILVLHMSEVELQHYFYTQLESNGVDPPAYKPDAFCDVISTSVHLHTGVNKLKIKRIAFIILHEIGHLYAYAKYGCDDFRWTIPEFAEPFADNFANRWLKKLIKEKLLNVE